MPILNLSRAEYDKLSDRVNFSTLKLMGKSPAHYRDRIQNPPGPDSDAMRLGRATHLAVLEPQRFRDEVVQWTGGRRAGAEWTAFAAAHRHQEILTAPEWERCLAVQASVRASDSASRYLLQGQAEQTILWSHRREAIVDFPEVHFACKGRLDWIGLDAIVDLKTSRDASPEAFSRSCWQFAYHAQAAFYADGLSTATGKRLPVVVIAVETTAPFVVQAYRVPDEVLEVGRETYRDWLDRLDLCRRENRWPGYADAEMSLSLPRWAVPQDDESIDEVGLTFGGE
jgi:hypothetical protein